MLPPSPLHLAICSTKQNRPACVISLISSLRAGIADSLVNGSRWISDTTGTRDYYTHGNRTIIPAIDTDLPTWNLLKIGKPGPGHLLQLHTYIHTSSLMSVCYAEI